VSMPCNSVNAELVGVEVAVGSYNWQLVVMGVDTGADQRGGSSVVMGYRRLSWGGCCW
jgi:hypothetical protein